MIIFKKISVKNFFSVGEQPIEIELNSHGTTLISGENGSGKSSVILDSLYFCLFGKPFRKINKGNVVNTINKKGCLISLTFYVGTTHYVINRGIKPDVFEIFKNDVLIDQHTSATEYQKYLETNILKMNEKAFRQIVVIGSATYKPFIELTPAERREIVEDLLNISTFSVMKSNVAIDEKRLKSEINVTDHNIDKLSQKIALLKKHKEDIENNLQRNRDEINAKIVSTKSGLEKLKSQLTDNIDNLNKIPSVVDDLKKFSDAKTKIISNTHVAKSKISALLSEDKFFTEHDHCSTCKQEISDTHKDAIKTGIKAELDSINVKAQKYQDLLTKANTAIENAQKTEDSRRSISQVISDLNSKIKYIEQNTLKDLDNQLENLSKNNTPQSFDKEVDELMALTENRKKLLEEKSYIDVILNMLKDSGIKSVIVSSYIDFINKTINEYLDRFGFHVSFEFNDVFEEKIQSRYIDDFQYNNFSQGEKQRIDMAIMFTWRDVSKLKNTMNTNLLILDETFDSSLDPNATDDLLGILTDLSEGDSTNVFVISHKNDLSDKMENHIEFEKYGNFTRIKNG
jgi:DNA repair exonuclease SbcCD ATPase subunit